MLWCAAEFKELISPAEAPCPNTEGEGTEHKRGADNQGELKQPDLHQPAIEMDEAQEGEEQYDSMDHCFLHSCSSSFFKVSVAIGKSVSPECVMQRDVSTMSFTPAALANMQKL